MNKKFLKIVIATGGTGGHVFPAYSLARHFTDKKIDVEITSDKRGLKYLQEYHDIKLTELPSSTIIKKNIIQFLFSITIIFYSILRSIIFLFLKKPNLVFGMGGYSSFSICIAAKILKIPFIIYENNFFIGKANRFLLPHAIKIFVSNKEVEGISEKYSDKICEIGNIIRKEIIDFKTKKNIGKAEKNLKILVLGGSQAAKIFAEKLPEVFKKCKDEKILIKVYQQCLPDQSKYLSGCYKKANIDFEIFNFDKNIINYFLKANLAITRSGSSMLAELLNAEIPFISVPLPSSADNHQLKNAIFYEKNNCGYIIDEKDLSNKLFKLIYKISKDTSLLDKIKSNQRQLSDKSVYENIEKQINRILDERY